MEIAKVLALSGIAMCLLGTWLVAIELVVRFQGNAYEIKTMTYRGQGTPEKTDDFSRWELHRARYMWTGLLLITLGSLAQMAAVCLTP